MAITIKYTGTQTRWPELAVTGKQSVWNPGQIESREDAEARLLLSTGVFTAENDTFLMLDASAGLLSGGAALTSSERAAVRGGMGFDSLTVRKPKSPIIGLKLHGSFETAAGVLGYTLSETLVSPVPFSAVRLRCYNVNAADIVGFAAGAAASANMAGGIFASTGTSAQFAVAGASTWTLPAASSLGGTADAIWSEVETDWLSVQSIARDDGGSGYLLVVRTYQPSAGNASGVRSAGQGATSADVNLYGVGAAARTGDYTGASWASFTSAITALAGPVAVEVMTTSGALTLGVYGDSTIAGQDGAKMNAGGPLLFAMSQLGASVPVCLWNNAEASMGTKAYLALALSHLRGVVKPQVAAFCAFSPNDADKYTAAGTLRQQMGLAIFANECVNQGVSAVFVTPCPVASITAEQEAFRRQVVESTKALATTFGAILVDRDAIYTDYSTTAGGWLSGMGSGVHPTPAGYAAEAALWEAALGY